MWYNLCIVRIHLPTNNFSFFKILVGGVLLLASAIYPMSAFAGIAILAVGQAHSIGAWLGMWRAGKLNYRLSLWIATCIIGVSYWGMNVVEYKTLWLVGAVLFVFHFLFDELELQQVQRTLATSISGVAPFLLISVYAVYDYFEMAMPMQYVLACILAVVVFELFIIKEINWYFVQSKILIAYTLYLFDYGVQVHYILAMILLYHYIFWFIYPVYKLHKYKREDRDGMIIVLLVITLSSIFVYSSKVWGISESADELTMRAFSIASLVHVLTTAPFAYMFGLKRVEHRTETE